MPPRFERIHVSLPIIPEVTASTLMGLYDVLSLFNDVVPDATPFDIDFIAEDKSELKTSSGISIKPHQSIHEIDQTDIIIVPSLLLDRGHWHKGRYPGMVRWLQQMYANGATLCSACSGVLLIAETGLLDQKEATVHWAYARTFRHNFPKVKLRLEKVLVVSGAEQRFVMSGASASWHDLALYLVARYASVAAAQTMAKFFLLQWHTDGQLPYIIFHEETDHDDEIVHAAQSWMKQHLNYKHPVDEVICHTGIPERTFKRRFRKATGYSPIAYIQNLRIEAAKQQLDTTQLSVDEISFNVGYDDPAFFRRLFKRITQLTPNEYRKKFLMPVIDTGKTGSGGTGIAAEQGR